jgi:hypothetical protein
MSSSSEISLKIAQFIARDDRSLPDHSLSMDISPKEDRNIGRVAVFINIENHQAINQVITIQSVEILSLPDHQLENFVFEPQLVELKPLEHSVVDIHLMNRTGYSGQGPVKAIVTYTLGNQVTVLESESVEVDRY